MNRRAGLRASDADREQAAERLRVAAMEGRLLAEELDERLGAALTARTYGDLDRLVSDLPVPAPRHRPERPPRPLRPSVILAVALVALVVIGSAVGDHGHADHGWSLGWLIWIVIGWRLLVHRRRRAR